MCNAFSCIVKQNGEVLWKFALDSHFSILEHFKVVDNESRKDFIKFIKVEITPNNKDYLNPDKWNLKVDEDIIPTWWTKSYEEFAWEEHPKWLNQLNKVLVRKPIINPFSVKPPKKITNKHLDLLKEWDSVRDSVGAYQGTYFNLSRKDWKYTEKIKTKDYPFQPLIDLWEIGLVPSFDGKIWRLHGGKDAKILWQGKI
jgi:hypothetical protein